MYHAESFMSGSDMSDSYEENWDMKKLISNVRKLVLTLSLISVGQVPAQNLCLGYYDGQNSSRTLLSRIGKVLEISNQEQLKALEEFSDVSIAQLKVTAMEIVKNSSVPISFESLNRQTVLDLVTTLKKKGFLFSEFHKKLFYGAASIPWGRWDGQPKKDFEGVSEGIYGTLESDFVYRKKLALSMLNELDQQLSVVIRGWPRWSSKDQFVALKNLGIKEPEFLALKEIYEMPRGKEYLAKVLEATLPTMHSIAYQQAAGISKKAYLAASPGLLALASVGGAAIGASSVEIVQTLIGFGTIVGGGFILASPDFTAGPVNKAWQKFRSRAQAEKQLTAIEENDRKLQAEALPDSSPSSANLSLAEQKNLIFDRIKRDFRSNPLSSVTDVYSYGQALFEATANLIERIPSSNKLKTLDEVTLALRNSIETDVHTAADRAQVRAKMEEINSQLNNYSIELAALKLDVFALASAHDRLSQDPRLQQMKRSGSLEIRQQIELKENSIASMQRQMEAIAALILQQQQSVFTNTAYLRETVDIVFMQPLINSFKTNQDRP